MLQRDGNDFKRFKREQYQYHPRIQGNSDYAVNDYQQNRDEQLAVLTRKRIHALV